ncbi:ANTAR domain-containing response regulator [Thalassomonas sp. M1454]|uniref:ANTAR domain-containing response regulator n=1 Tax=Thalassomonas sp. M1454 TaxID=2594477 RepID=UPI0011816979|nr:ANTAR domain-containing protein [Thalassomonas sp. M1454]TRX56569.1 ANTAR domain-containing protein [Thalassomonas sp. M1454]
MKSKNTLSLASKLKVLLVETDSDKAQILEGVLQSARYDVTRVINSGIPLLKQVETTQPDIIIIDMESPDRDMLENLHRISHSTPKPVVIFSEEEDQNTITQLVKSGVSAYVIGGIDYSRVKSIVDIAVARFAEYQGLKDELKLTKQKLTSQKSIEKAKLWLMQSRNLSENDAYHFIRKTAMDNSQKVEDVAKNMLAMADMFAGESA